MCVEPTGSPERSDVRSDRVEPVVGHCHVVAETEETVGHRREVQAFDWCPRVVECVGVRAALVAEWVVTRRDDRRGREVSVVGA